MDRIVVGLPLHSDGAPSEQGRRTEKWAREVATALSLPCAYVDERYSSERALVESGAVDRAFDDLMKQAGVQEFRWREVVLNFLVPRLRTSSTPPELRAQALDAIRMYPPSHVQGRIRDGVIEAGPFELALPVTALDARFTLNLHNARVRLTLGKDRSMRGVMGMGADEHEQPIPTATWLKCLAPGAAAVIRMSRSAIAAAISWHRTRRRRCAWVRSAPLIIVAKLEQYDYAGATAVAVVMLGFSFLLLLVINALQAWQRRRTGALS